MGFVQYFIFGHFLTSAFSISIFLWPSARFLGRFWPSEGCFLTFFTSLMPVAFHSVNKVKKRPSSGQKIQKTGLRPQKTVNASGLQLKKCPKKLDTSPKPYICPSLFFVWQISTIYTKPGGMKTSSLKSFLGQATLGYG